MRKGIINPNDNSDIIKQENEISPYNPQYPIQYFTGIIKRKIESAQTIVEDIYHTAIGATPIVNEIGKSFKEGYRLVVDVSDEMLQDIKTKKVKLTKEHNQYFAQLKKNGKYSDKLPIKEERFKEAVDPTKIANALQMKAIQDQLEKITEQIAIIDNSVNAVLEGLQNDRIGLYYSGMALYLEAREVGDPELQKLLMMQAVKALSESNFQLMLALKADISFLATGKYKLYKGKSRDAIDERMQNINQTFAFIHQAMLLKAGIYCEIDETKAMAVVLREYSYFIENEIARNALLLAQCDVKDAGAADGIWAARAKLRLDVEDIQKHIPVSGDTLYLAFVEENNDA